MTVKGKTEGGDERKREWRKINHKRKYLFYEKMERGREREGEEDLKLQPLLH